MGIFPFWVLGVIISLIAAAILLMMSLQTQSASRRVRISAYEIERRVRALTSLALALLVLGLGFFAAGAPLSLLNDDKEPGGDMEAAAESILFDGTPPVKAEIASQDSDNQSNVTSDDSPDPASFFEDGFSDEDDVDDEDALLGVEDISSTIEQLEPTDEPSPTPTDSPSGTPPPTDTPTHTPTPTNTPTDTPTPTPTNTPTKTPTLTPTPITEDTATINTGGGTLWLHDTPGGENIALMKNSDIVILRPGNANYAGAVWKEVMKLDGVTGWVERRYLEFNQ